MAPRTIYLLSYRNAPTQRAHFAIFVPSAADHEKGTVIHAVGAPMVGYKLQFKRNYVPSLNLRSYELFSVGQVDSANIVDSTGEEVTVDEMPRDNIEIAASEVPTPGISENFMSPVNHTTNRRCQEWTMEYVRHLVGKGFLEAESMQIVHSKRDPPNHGIGLRHVAQN